MNLCTINSTIFQRKENERYLALYNILFKFKLCKILFKFMDKLFYDTQSVYLSKSNKTNQNRLHIKIGSYI